MKKKQLKERIKKLENDLRTVVLKPNSSEAMSIGYRVRIKASLEEAVWFGHGIFGILQQVKTKQHGPNSNGSVQH